MMMELGAEFTRSFGAPEMAQTMEGVKGLIAFGMIASVLIGVALGLITALFQQISSASFASADRDSGPQAPGVGEHSGDNPAHVNETAALAAVAAALEAPARPASAGGYLEVVAVPVIILAIIIGVAMVSV